MKVRDRTSTAEGKIRIKDLVVTAGKGTFPAAATFSFAGRYDATQDQASLDSCSLQINDLFKLTASGIVQQIRQKRVFAATVSLAPVELSAIVHPAATGVAAKHYRERKNRGLDPSRFRRCCQRHNCRQWCHLASRGRSHQGARAVVKGLSVDASILKVDQGWQLRGHMGSGSKSGKDSCRNSGCAFFRPALQPPQASVCRASARFRHSCRYSCHRTSLLPSGDEPPSRCGWTSGRHPLPH